MRDSFWIPLHEEAEEDNRPMLEAPSPLEYLPPWEPLREEGRESEAPRVIIIDI